MVFAGERMAIWILGKSIDGGGEFIEPPQCLIDVAIFGPPNRVAMEVKLGSPKK